MRRLIGLLTTAAVGLLGSAVIQAPALAAPTGLDVGLTGFSDLVVDQAHGHVFISQGTNTVVVTDLSGTVTTSLTGLYGASGMTLSPDGTTLWVALSTGDAVAAVDTTTLAKTSYPTGTSTCPSTVALAAGEVWFAGSCGSGEGLHGLDPSTGAVTASFASLSSPLLVASPDLPGQVFAIEKGISPSTLYAYTATGGDTPALTLRTSRWNTGENGRDLAIAPGGATIVQASGYPYDHPAFSTTDLSSAGSYPSATYPDAIAFRSDGLLAAGVDGIYNDDIYLFHDGSDSLLRSYEVGELEPGGLAFGSQDLYAVASSGSGAPRLFVLDPSTPEPTASTVQVSTDRSTYAYAATAHVHVTLATDSPDRSVTVYKTVDGVRTAVTTATVPVGGTLSVSVRVYRRTTFTASYAGDDVSLPSSAATTVRVHAKLLQHLFGAVSRSGTHYVFIAGKRVGYAAQVLPNHSGDCVYISLQYLVNGSYRNGSTTPCEVLDSSSRLAVAFASATNIRGHTVRLRGQFRGDADNLAAPTQWLYIRFK